MSTQHTPTTRIIRYFLDHGNKPTRPGFIAAELGESTEDVVSVLLDDTLFVFTPLDGTYWLRTLDHNVPPADPVHFFEELEMCVGEPRPLTKQ
jgi:hypothetical protein